MKRMRIGWFSSGRGQGSIDLFLSVLGNIETGFLPVEIVYVFCDRAEGDEKGSDRFLTTVKEKGIPLITHSSSALREKIRRKDPDIEDARLFFDSEVIDLLGRESQRLKANLLDVDFVILAGYMLKISFLLCDAFRCINLHPDLPGRLKGTWRQVIWKIIESRFLEAGERTKAGLPAEALAETGAMMHFVVPELDAGQAITYFKFKLAGPELDPLWEAFDKKSNSKAIADIKTEEGDKEPLFAKIRQEGLKREFPLIILTLKALAENDFEIGNGDIVHAYSCDAENVIPFPEGVNITDEVEILLEYLEKNN